MLATFPALIATGGSWLLYRTRWIKNSSSTIVQSSMDSDGFEEPRPFQSGGEENICFLN